MENIRTWINGSREYQSGVKLLLQYSDDKKLHRLFTTEAATDFKKTLLHKQLLQILTQQGIQKIVIEEKKEAVVQNIALAHTGWPQEMDEVMMALHAQWKPLFSKLNFLCNNLYEVAKLGKKDKTKEAEAGRMAHEILGLDDACDKLYDKRDHYLQHGALPNEAAPKGAVVDPLKLPLALSNAQRQLREARLRLTKQPTNEKIAATIKKNEGLVAYYKQLLKLD